MSGICGIIHLDGAPVKIEMLQKMTAAIAYRGPDGIRYWVQSNAGLAHLALHTTPESLNEQQPLVSRRGDFVLVADARVDNRDELIRVLRAKACLEQQYPTDADLILAAYECWGQDCPKEIVGDFAFVIWDIKKQKTFAARDVFGVRQLVYAFHRNSFFVSSGIPAILSILPEPPPLNRELLQDSIASVYDRWVDQTEYQGILRLPPSYSLLLTPERKTLQRYWIIGDQPRPRYKSKIDYIDHYRDLFENSVLAQLRSCNPVAIFGGGGLDSGSILGISEKLIASKQSAASVYQYTSSFNNTPHADEETYVKSLEDFCPHLQFNRVPCDDCWAMHHISEIDHYPLDELDFALTSPITSFRLLARARQDDCKISITGNNGDQLLGQSSYALPACLRDVHFSDLRQEVPRFQRNAKHPAWQLLAYAYIRPLISQGMRNRLYTLIQNLQKKKRPIDFLSPAPQYFNYLSPPRLSSVTSSYSYANLMVPIAIARLHTVDKVHSYFGMEHRLPFLNRRLVDYVLSLSPELIFHSGQVRAIHREAMRGILPEQNRLRTTKAYFHLLAHRGFMLQERERIIEILSNSILVHYDLVDVDCWRDAWNMYWSSSLTGNLSMPDNVGGVRLWKLIGPLDVELWLRKNKPVQQNILNNAIRKNIV